MSAEMLLARPGENRDAGVVPAAIDSSFAGKPYGADSGAAAFSTGGLVAAENLLAISKEHASVAGLVQAGEVSEKMFLAMAQSYLNLGASNLEAACDEAMNLRHEYEKKIKRHKVTKVAALCAESLLMAYYGYGAIEHYTGYKGSAQAVLANSAISGGISVTRATVQYGLMKRGEESFKEGNRARGMLFTGIGLTLALINSLFVANGFAEKYILQEQAQAMQELDKISHAEAAVHAEKADAASHINTQIDELDQKISHIKSGSGDPRLEVIEQQMKRLSDEIDGIRNNPLFNDGKNTEWDKAARIDMTRDQNQIANLQAQKQNILGMAGSHLSPEQQAMLDATTQQRLALNDQIKGLDERYQPQLEALHTSRALWEAKLHGVSSAGGNTISAMKENPAILIEALANVAAISVANWWAATEGHKQETAEAILSGSPDNPWVTRTAQERSTKPQSAGDKVFMGYDFSADAMHHLRNEPLLKSLLEKLDNPKAILAEMKAEITRQHSLMVTVLNEISEGFDRDDYAVRLSNINTAYSKALVLLDSDEMAREVSQVVGRAAFNEKSGVLMRAFGPLKGLFGQGRGGGVPVASPVVTASTPPVQTAAVQVAPEVRRPEEIPVFADDKDPDFVALAPGKKFVSAEDGIMRVKRTPAVMQAVQP